jgi:hypothetical protein
MLASSTSLFHREATAELQSDEKGQGFALCSTNSTTRKTSVLLIAEHESRARPEGKIPKSFSEPSSLLHLLNGFLALADGDPVHTYVRMTYVNQDPLNIDLVLLEQT